MAASERFDLDRCIHCGLCLNACPTYRELGWEMDSPRGRIYQMVRLAQGEAQIGAPYLEHIGLCLACRACESACPSGVPYGRLIENARTEIERVQPHRAREFLFDRLLVSPRLMSLAGNLLHLYRASGLHALARRTGLLKTLVPLAPAAERPYFFRHIGRTFPSEGPRRCRVALMAGCIANVFFARLNEATVRVLQKNGCEVVVPAGQTCCGALHVHSGFREGARKLARQNVDAVLAAGCDFIITNAAGCGSTLKEYGELLETADAVRFSSLLRDVNEFLAALDLNPEMHPVNETVTYQDSCHLAHGQRVRQAPRKLLAAVPGLQFREMPLADQCCGSAGIYNIVHNEMSDAILRKKMECINQTGATIIATANPGCLLQLRAGVEMYGRGQRVAHVVEILHQAYSEPKAAPLRSRL